MWRSWSRSSSNSDKPINNNNNDKRKSFRCSSFKDIENLCLDFSDDYSPKTSDINSITTTNHHLRRPSLPSIFHRVRTANALLSQWPRSDNPPISDPRIVVYYTSLRVIRPTFEACRSVLSILQGFRVSLDQRDLAMDSSFMSELRDLLGLKSSHKLGLPRVFIGGRYIGGAEEIKQLHEIGELKILISGMPLAKADTCDSCGGYRFILCTHCNGSHKIYSDKTLGFRTCHVCNENGLLRCPLCSSPPPSLLS